MDTVLFTVYHRLLDHFGPQKWWPADTPFEVIIGAILTQGVNWKNVEKAIANLAQARVLDPARLAVLPEDELAELIKPAGYYRVKARKIKSFLAFLRDRHGNNLTKLFEVPLAELRSQLLGIWGIGPETADSILLYAGSYPSFVVDAYTKRIMSRLGLVSAEIKYEGLRSLFQENLPSDTKLFNEFHALFVSLGKDYCQKNNPRCGDCPLKEICIYGRGEG
jgi:endonuclease-3 related protein